MDVVGKSSFVTIPQSDGTVTIVNIRKWCTCPQSQSRTTRVRSRTTEVCWSYAAGSSPGSGSGGLGPLARARWLGDQARGSGSGPRAWGRWLRAGSWERDCSGRVVSGPVPKRARSGADPEPTTFWSGSIWSTRFQKQGTKTRLRLVVGDFSGQGLWIDLLQSSRLDDRHTPRGIHPCSDRGQRSE